MATTYRLTLTRTDDSPNYDEGDLAGRSDWMAENLTVVLTGEEYERIKRDMFDSRR